MDKKEVLKICVESGFFLDRGMLDYFVSLDDFDLKGVISKLKNFGVKGGILSLDVFEKYKNKLGVFDSGVSDSSNCEVEFEVLKDSGKIEIRDFISYFRYRFEVLRDFLIKRNDINNLTSIRRIGRENGFFSIIGMVYSKRITKNKNLLIEVEDLTGRIIVLINRENKQLFEQGKELLLDDIVCFKCNGSSKMLFVSDIFYPDSCLNREILGSKDEFVAFVSDFHVGSSDFLEGNLMRFISWLNGEVGDSRQKAMALKVKYLVLAGNGVDGVGVYSGQEKFLKIKGILGQYKKLADILGQIRKDVEIIVCPGRHDAVWTGEPQPKVDKKWCSELIDIENLKFVSNPCVLNIDDLKFFIYSGGSIDNFRSLLSKGKDKKINEIIGEILKRRHLAPVYSEMDIIVSKEKDDLILRDVFDVFVLGGQGILDIGSYNNILTISNSCWKKGMKNFGKVDYCKVPIFNLKNREVKVLDFSNGDGVFENEKGLDCCLEGLNG